MGIKFFEMVFYTTHAIGCFEEMRGISFRLSIMITLGINTWQTFQGRAGLGITVLNDVQRDIPWIESYMQHTTINCQPRNLLTTTFQRVSGHPTVGLTTPSSYHLEIRDAMTPSIVNDSPDVFFFRQQQHEPCPRKLLQNLRLQQESQQNGDNWTMYSCADFRPFP